MLKLACQHKHNGKRKVTTPKHGVVVGEFCQWCPSSQHLENDKIFETIEKEGVCMGYVLMGGRLRKVWVHLVCLRTFHLLKLRKIMTNFESLFRFIRFVKGFKQPSKALDWWTSSLLWNMSPFHYVFHPTST